MYDEYRLVEEAAAHIQWPVEKLRQYIKDRKVRSEHGLRRVNRLPLLLWKQFLDTREQWDPVPPPPETDPEKIRLAEEQAMDDLVVKLLTWHRPRGVIYFVACCEFVKIGFASNFDYRVAELQTGNPHELTILSTVHGTIDGEHLLHRVFEAQRRRGEWFEHDGRLARFIEKLRSRLLESDHISRSDWRLIAPSRSRKRQQI